MTLYLQPLPSDVPRLRPLIRLMNMGLTSERLVSYEETFMRRSAQLNSEQLS